VACILAKYQRYNGMESKVLSPNSILTNYKFDKFGILKCYRDYVDVVRGFNYADYCVSEAKNADIIHIHSLEELVVKMRKTFGNSKKIILHYHGTDIRGLKPNFSIPHNMKTKTKLFAAKVRNRIRLIKTGYYKSLPTLRKESQKLADEILVSTPDLLSLLPTANYLPNPVDLEHFSKDNPGHEKSEKTALTIKTESGNIEKTLQYCKENNIDLKIDVFDRTKTPLLHEEVPHLLRKYNVYVDIRVVNEKILESLSKTALESLACGLRVLNYKLEYINKLPEIHNPVNVIKRLEKIYNQSY
jgi:glycosyltransferase involved in cell wall biosynthesis